MQTLLDIPFALDAERILAQAHVPAGSADAAELLALCDLARERGRPKAAYAVSYVTGRDGDRVRIDGVWFASRILAHQLAAAERVFPHVATCGHELDAVRVDRDDMLKAYWWDLVKAQLLGAAHRHLVGHLGRRYRLGRTATMSPGSGDATVWPIDQQRELFALLGDVEGAIGVELTGSCLMVPNKTISGLLFPTEVDFHSCQVCHREGCPARGAPFDPALWERARGDAPA